MCPSPPGPPSATPTEVANPGGGNEIVFTLGDNLIFTLVGLTYKLTTNAGGGNRQTHIIITDGTNIIMRFATTNKTAGGVAQFVSWNASGQSLNDSAGNVHMNTIPANITLYPGFVLSTSTALIDGVDTYTDIFLWFTQFLTPATA